MRILSLHTRYLVAGGEDRVYEEEAQMLTDRGHAVERLELSNERLTQIGPLRAAAATVWNRQTAAQLRGRIDAFKPDIVHIHNDFPWASPSVYRAASRAGVAAVHTLHNFPQPLCKRAVLPATARCVKTASTTRWPRPPSATPATAAAAPPPRRSPPAAPCTPPGAPGAETSRSSSPPPRSWRDRHIAGGFPADRVVVKPHFVRGTPRPGEGQGGYALFVGRLMPDKGLDRLLAAWHDMPGTLRLRIVGDGPLRDAAEAAAADPARRIDLLGPSRPKPSTACFKTPRSRWSPRRSTKASAAWSSRPSPPAPRCWPPGHGSPGVLIDHGVTGWTYRFDAADGPDALHTRLATLLSDPTPGAALRTAARRAFEERFTEEANYPQLIAAYQKAMDA